MAEPELHIVTGAFGYSGQYITQRLLDAGHRVATLTNSPDRPNPFGKSVEVYPYNFDAPGKLAESLRGARALYITYWVRFNHRDFKHSQAVDNTLTLFDAAKSAGVERVVHTSITNPSEDSPLEYFSGKARLERALKESGLSHAILRPAVLFGGADILVNNIAWALRKFPLMAVFGKGDYKLQPIYVEDFAKLAVEQGALRENRTIDAIGPETFTYRELAERIGEIIGKRRRIVSLPPFLGYLSAKFLGWFVGDVMLTLDEIKGLMAGLLCTDSAPAGMTRLTEWATEHADELGRKYASELARRKNRTEAYAKL